MIRYQKKKVLLMKIIKDAQKMQQIARELRGSIGFVPTMGALHAGHLSLIQKARLQNEHLIVSIFVNPTQFLEGEDLEQYPRTKEADEQICKRAGVDILFMPDKEQMYELDELCIGAPAKRGYILEGAKRPGHFDGMLQVVMKLLNITNASKAYFGKKDAQQLALVKQMVKNYFMPTKIVACDIVRDERGLALSSRNRYLNSEEKERALALSSSLKAASVAIISGERSVENIEQIMRDRLNGVDKIEYAAALSREFKPIDQIVLDESILLVAAWVGKTRLIDNLWV